MQLPPIVNGDLQQSQRSLASDDPHLRQVILSNVGINGQARLTQAHVAVIGAGALGTAALPILAAAGIGQLTIIDPDHIEPTNLARQLLYAPSDIGHQKAVVAARQLQQMTPALKVNTIMASFSARMLDSIDIVLDATDDLNVRFAINDAARRRHIPDVFGAALEFAGQWSVFHHIDDVDVDIRTVFPDQHAELGSCETNGIWTPVTQIVGAAMADQALRLAMGMTGVALGTLHVYDSNTGTVDVIPLATTAQH